jgi:hypothetical protein
MVSLCIVGPPFGLNREPPNRVHVENSIYVMLHASLHPTRRPGLQPGSRTRIWLLPRFDVVTMVLRVRVVRRAALLLSRAFSCCRGTRTRGRNPSRCYNVPVKNSRCRVRSSHTRVNRFRRFTVTFTRGMHACRNYGVRGSLCHTAYDGMYCTPYANDNV